MTKQPQVGHGLLNIEASRSHSDTPQSVGLLWTSDQLSCALLELSCVYYCSCLVCIVVILYVCCTMCVLLFLL